MKTVLYLVVLCITALMVAPVVQKPKKSYSEPLATDFQHELTIKHLKQTLKKEQRAIDSLEVLTKKRLVFFNNVTKK